MAWSASYGTLALAWAAGAPGFPFGEGDPEGAAMGSVPFAVPAEPTGLVMAGWCVAGVIVAGAMRRPTSHLAIATSAYHHRRRDRDRAAAGARRRQGTPC